jgi:hypothetical protein
MSKDRCELRPGKLVVWVPWSLYFVWSKCEGVSFFCERSEEDVVLLGLVPMSASLFARVRCVFRLFFCFVSGFIFVWVCFWLSE